MCGVHTHTHARTRTHTQARKRSPHSVLPCEGGGQLQGGGGPSPQSPPPRFQAPLQAHWDTKVIA